MKKERVTLLGATGSIGRSAADVCLRHPDRYEVVALAGGSRVGPLVEAARKLGARRVVVADETKAGELRTALDAAGLREVESGAGMRDVAALAESGDTDAVLQAIVGAAGLEPTFAAAGAGKRLLLANKESVVCGGELLMRTVEEGGALLLPVDSEHSAIFQSLAGATPQARGKARIILTASGGPFRGKKRADLEGVTPERAVAHPKWSMGRKISVDSATLMNKGLEVIEARWLFDVPCDRIDVLVHPESVIHSMVAYEDGAVMAELGDPDMRTPIAVALAWPERISAGVKMLDLARIGRLTFEEPDRETFPLLDAAYEALRSGGNATIRLNAANEVAVEAFLAGRIGFTGIFDVVRRTLDRKTEPVRTLEDILAFDRQARAEALRLIER